MRIDARIEGDLTVVTVSGELLGEPVATFRHAVSEAFDAGRRDFLVDLSAARALDSAALEALTALQRRAQEALGMLHLVVPDATLRKLFEITRLNQQLSIHDNLEQARSAFLGAFAVQGTAGGAR